MILEGIVAYKKRGAVDLMEVVAIEQLETTSRDGWNGWNYRFMLRCGGNAVLFIRDDVDPIDLWKRCHV